MIKTIHDWGMYPEVEAEFIETKNTQSVYPLVKDSHSVIARGNGRCYGDSALNSTIFSTLQLNKMLLFNQREGILSCQSGVLLSDILELVVPKGFFLPVTPGTKFITVGGAVAADVHGKNHHKDGCFSTHVRSFDLLVETGEVLSCTPSEHADLFWKTCGGMGLTGIILQVTLNLLRIKTAYIRQKSLKACNLQEIMGFFSENENYTYSVAWIDCLAAGKHIGKSILMVGEHALPHELSPGQSRNPLLVNDGTKLSVPFVLPAFILNAHSVKAFNYLYYNKQHSDVRHSVLHYESFFYPLDGILNWNRIYGRNGFTQYQFVLPLEGSEQGLRDILGAIAKSGEGSFLAVLKLFGEENSKAAMSFPKRGYTLALDFKISDKVFKLLDHLDEIVARYGGRLYLAKDARMSAEYFRQTYDRIIDHPLFFQSLQSKRLEL